MKQTIRYTALLLALLLCGVLAFTSCNHEKTVGSADEESQITTERFFPNHEIKIPEGPEVEPAMAHFMSMQAKIQFKDVPWGSTPGEITEYMKTQDCLIEEGLGYIHGKAVLESFYEQSRRGDEGYLKIVHHYPKDEKYPKDEASVYLTLIYFDGELYHKTSVDANGKTDGGVRSFRYLMHYTGHSENSSTSFDYSYYFLTNDDTITYGQIRYSMYSSNLQTAMLFFSVSEICGELTNYVIKE